MESVETSFRGALEEGGSLESGQELIGSLNQIPMCGSWCLYKQMQTCALLSLAKSKPPNSANKMAIARWSLSTLDQKYEPE